MSASNIDLTQFLSQQYLCESLTITEVQTLLDYTELVSCTKNDVMVGECCQSVPIPVIHHYYYYYYY